jgi:hypothetical protein
MVEKNKQENVNVFVLPACTMLPTKVPDHKSFDHVAGMIVEKAMGKWFVPPYKDPLYMRPFKVVLQQHKDAANMIFRAMKEPDMIVDLHNGYVTQVKYSRILDEVVLLTIAS